MLTDGMVINLLIVIILMVSGVGLRQFFIWLNQRGDDNALIALPYIYDAIIQAEKISDAVWENTQEKLSGADKKKIADQMYHLLPQTIKNTLSYGAFSILVQEIFDNSLRHLDTFKQTLDESIKADLGL